MITRWRSWLRRRPAIGDSDIEELEGHLRDVVADLRATGLAADEAFLVAVKRMGNLDAVSREFAREPSERLWKQLVMDTAADGAADRTALRETVVAVALAFGAGPVAINAFPSTPPGHTLTLAALHLPIALWLIVGIAYTGGRWRDGSARMDFVRFSGELFIYYVLMALGGGVLMVFTGLAFAAIGTNAGSLVSLWLLPCGVVGAVIVGAWLVEAKQSVVENMAPVLTRLFTPLFAAVLLAFLVTMVWTRSGIGVEREVLIGFDLLLVVVLGLLLYSVSARDPQAPPGVFDALQLLLVLCALVVDIVALAAIAGRISEFGVSPNKLAALGENLVLLVSLSWSAWLYARFFTGRGSFAALERWQTLTCLSMPHGRPSSSSPSRRCSASSRAWR